MKSCQEEEGQSWDLGVMLCKVKWYTIQRNEMLCKVKYNVWLWKVVKKKNKVGTWGSWIPNTLTSCPFGPNLLYNFSLYIDLCNNQRCSVLVIFSSFLIFFLFHRPFCFLLFLTMVYVSKLQYCFCCWASIVKRARFQSLFYRSGKLQSKWNGCSFRYCKGHHSNIRQWQFKI